jgi:uncharacterized protein YndB with AHSA1/START domain
MSIRFEVSDVMGATPEQVFDALLDLEAADRWMPGLVRMERLAPGPLDVGSEWRETRKMFGREATEQFRLVSLERPHRLELHVDGSKGSSGRGEHLFEYQIHSIPEGAKVDLKGEIRGLTGLMGLLGKLFVGPYKKACVKDLRGLRFYLEEGEQGAGMGE